MLARNVEEWRHSSIVDHLNFLLLTLACSDCDTAIVLYAAREMGYFTPKIEALFTLTVEDRSSTSAAVLVELIAGINYLAN